MMHSHNTYITRIIIALGMLSSATAPAQVTVDARLDSLRMIQGQQTRLTLTVNCKQGQRIGMPSYKEGDEVMPGLEVVCALRRDTTTDETGGTMRISNSYAVTSFDTAHYELPPFAITVDKDTLTTKRLRLEVYPMEVDTANVSKFFPIKDVQQPALGWKDWKYVAINGILALLFIIIASVLFYWRRHGIPVIRILRRKPKLPPHVVAMNEIEELKENKQLAADDSKAYYTQLTDTLRTYIRDRYRFNALEMTSTEIIARLSQENDQEALNELNELFQTADLAKFAKYNALLNENDTHLLTAIDYVNRTKQEVDPNKEEEKPKLSADDMRHIVARRVLGILIIILILAIIGLLGYDVYRTLQLLS